MTASIFRRVSRDAHLISKYSGDLAALQSGGVPKYGKRVVRRTVTRKVVGPMWSRLWR